MQLHVIAASTGIPYIVPPPQLPASATNQPREFVSGLRMDWRRRRVEIDGKIVLREGPLELLACTPQTREHESIIVVRPRAMEVFHALGLIGLTPGRPVQYDAERDRWLAPSGEALRLRIRYRQGGIDRTVPVEDWLIDTTTDRRPGPLTWVFAGSRTLGDGRFGADLDGTVVTLVDFDTALIAVGGLHSADNELLWLRADSGAIPPAGRECTLLVGGAAAVSAEVEVTIGTDGKLRRNDTTLTVEALVNVVSPKPPAPDAAPAPAESGSKVIVLRPADDTTSEIISSLVEGLARAGVDKESIEVRTAAR